MFKCNAGALYCGNKLQEYSSTEAPAYSVPMVRYNIIQKQLFGIYRTNNFPIVVIGQINVCMR